MPLAALLAPYILNEWRRMSTRRRNKKGNYTTWCRRRSSRCITMYSWCLVTEKERNVRVAEEDIEQREASLLVSPLHTRPACCHLPAASLLLLLADRLQNIIIIGLKCSSWRKGKNLRAREEKEEEEEAVEFDVQGVDLYTVFRQMLCRAFLLYTSVDCCMKSSFKQCTGGCKEWKKDKRRDESLAWKVIAVSRVSNKMHRLV